MANLDILRRLLCHFSRSPVCVGCKQYPAVEDFLCRHCQTKMTDFIARRKHDRSCLSQGSSPVG